MARHLVQDTNRDDVYIVSGYTSSKNPAINSMQSILQHSHVIAGWVWRVLALVMLPVSVALAVDSIDLSLEKARTLVQQGQYAEALPLLRALPLDGSDQYDILFLIGLASMELAVRTSDTTGRRDDLLEQAIFAFRAMLIDQPGLVGDATKRYPLGGFGRVGCAAAGLYGRRGVCILSCTTQGRLVHIDTRGPYPAGSDRDLAPLITKS